MGLDLTRMGSSKLRLRLFVSALGVRQLLSEPVERRLALHLGVAAGTGRLVELSTEGVSLRCVTLFGFSSLRTRESR